MYDKTHELVSDMLNRLWSMPGVSYVAIRRAGSPTRLAGSGTIESESPTWSRPLDLALDTLDGWPETAETLRLVSRAHTIHCRRSGAWSVAVLTHIGHPVAKSIQRSMRAALRKLSASEAA